MTQPYSEPAYQKNAASLFQYPHQWAGAGPAPRRAGQKQWLPIQSLLFALLISISFWAGIFIALKRIL
jgi:hypothetical protein